MGHPGLPRESMVGVVGLSHATQRRFSELRAHPPHIFLDWVCDRFFVYFIIATVSRLKPSQQRHGPFTGIAASTANGHVKFFVQRPVIIEVLYRYSGGARLRHRSIAIYASFVSCSNLSLILLRNTVCVGHGGAATRPDQLESALESGARLVQVIRLRPFLRWHRPFAHTPLWRRPIVEHSPVRAAVLRCKNLGR